MTLPEPPLGRADEWKTVTLDLGDGPKQYRRELNTMPQWAGSCWYYLALHRPSTTQTSLPTRQRAVLDERRSIRRRRRTRSIAPALLALLAQSFVRPRSRYHTRTVPTALQPGLRASRRLPDDRDIYVDAFSVDRTRWRVFLTKAKQCSKQTGKMGKSLKNAVNPDDIYEEYGADSLRLYEMSMGPLDADRPWTTNGIVGLYRFLQRLWRNIVDEETGEVNGRDAETDEATKRLLHKTIAGVRDDMEALRFNTAIAKLIEFNNHLTKDGPSQPARWQRQLL